MDILNIDDFRYNLPEEQIALYPLANRDESKLLVYDKGRIIHKHFFQLTEFLPANAFLFFNNTKVIPARLHFRKDTGAEIEIFLLSPLNPSPLLSQTMMTANQCAWKCTIGNVKRWQVGTTLVKAVGEELLRATLINKTEGLVQFSWSGGKSFAEIIEYSGETPLPPYLKRNSEDADRERYQTVYCRHEGAVAAPTAGLHFTSNTFEGLTKKNIQHDFLTLHVSAGTFQPIKTKDVHEHSMHSEQVVISKRNIDNLLTPHKFIIPVGTTSMRTLESLYWFGVKLTQDNKSEFKISQDDPYRPHTQLPSVEKALLAVKEYMITNGLNEIVGETSIFIKPGYIFRICKGLITNFHQPASTLILLVAAFIGGDWRKVYEEAMKDGYRFLSYGDSSLLLP